MIHKPVASHAGRRNSHGTRVVVWMTELDLNNRRGAERIPVLKDGLISFSLGRETMPCFVQDISETGAKMQVASVDHTPSNFKLIIESENFSIDCIVVWRSVNEIGVIFETGSL